MILPRIRVLLVVNFAILNFISQGILNTAWSIEKNEPLLTIQSPEKTLTYKRSELLSRPDVKTVIVKNDPSYSGKQMTYTAVPAASLFKNLTISDEAVIQFKCLDGFSAPIRSEILLHVGPGDSIPYIAIESENQSWPKLREGKDDHTAGPFYLVWENPKASGVTQEEWPFQLTGFEIKKSLKQIYPAIFPDPALEKTSTVSKGFHVFTKNCFPCHTMNQQGEGKMGPDLNLPMNPTEYYQTQALKAFIRNPKQVRTWPTAKMGPFPPETISDSELGQLIDYLKHMAQRRKPR
jgi:mono/diheme cytochrome c family protein